jgi:hypothetical protein
MAAHSFSSRMEADVLMWQNPPAGQPRAARGRAKWGRNSGRRAKLDHEFEMRLLDDGTGAGRKHLHFISGAAHCKDN